MNTQQLGTFTILGLLFKQIMLFPQNIFSLQYLTVIYKLKNTPGKVVFSVPVEIDVCRSPAKKYTMPDKTVLILSDKNPHDESGLFPTGKKFKEVIDSKNINNHIVFTKNAIVKREAPDKISIKNAGEKPFYINPANTVAFMRNSAIDSRHGADIVEDLEDYGVYMVNSLKSTNLVNDKQHF